MKEPPHQLPLPSSWLLQLLLVSLERQERRVEPREEIPRDAVEPRLHRRLL